MIVDNIFESVVRTVLHELTRRPLDLGRCCASVTSLHNEIVSVTQVQQRESSLGRVAAPVDRLGFTLQCHFPSAPCPSLLSSALPVLFEFLTFCHNQDDEYVRDAENAVANITFKVLLWHAQNEAFRSVVQSNLVFLLHASRMQLLLVRDSKVLVEHAPSFTELSGVSSQLTKYDDYIWITALCMAKLGSDSTRAWISTLLDDPHGSPFVMTLTEIWFSVCHFCAVRFAECSTTFVKVGLRPTYPIDLTPTVPAVAALITPPEHARVLASLADASCAVMRACSEAKEARRDRFLSAVAWLSAVRFGFLLLWLGISDELTFAVWQKPQNSVTLTAQYDAMLANYISGVLREHDLSTNALPITAQCSVLLAFRSGLVEMQGHPAVPLAQQTARQCIQFAVSSSVEVAGAALTSSLHEVRAVFHFAKSLSSGPLSGLLPFRRCLDMFAETQNSLRAVLPSARADGGHIAVWRNVLRVAALVMEAEAAPDNTSAIEPFWELCISCLKQTPWGPTTSRPVGVAACVIGEPATWTTYDDWSQLKISQGAMPLRSSVHVAMSYFNSALLSILASQNFPEAASRCETMALVLYGTDAPSEVVVDLLQFAEQFYEKCNLNDSALRVGAMASEILLTLLVSPLAHDVLTAKLEKAATHM